MKTRRITLALGAAAGGLLAAAFLPLAVANADSGDVIDVTSDAMRATPPDVFGFEADVARKPSSRFPDFRRFTSKSRGIKRSTTSPRTATTLGRSTLT